MKKINKKKETKKKRQLGKSLFIKYFGFEQGTDITNNVSVLKRRNQVIKNIILVTNLFYFLLMTIVSLLHTSRTDKIFNYILTIATFPTTFAINYFLKFLINKGGTQNTEANLTKQQVAMYFGVAYLFVSALTFYIKVSISHRELETFCYLFFYYTIIIVSLYQDKRTLLNSSIAMFAIMTIIHFFLTHNVPRILNEGVNTKNYETVKTTFVDIGLRFIIYIMFIVVLFAAVSISQYMQEQRRTELIKRKEVQGDFISISKDLFDVVLSSSKDLLNKQHAELVWLCTKRMSELLGYSLEKINELKKYSLIHLRSSEISDFTVFKEEVKNQEEYLVMREKTELAATISKRIQLAQKCEDIIRAQEEKTITENFIIHQNKIQPELNSQIILFADLYVTMRDFTSYKRPKNHKEVLKLFNEILGKFLPEKVLVRFTNFDANFETIYNNYDL